MSFFLSTRMLALGTVLMLAGIGVALGGNNVVGGVGLALLGLAIVGPGVYVRVRQFGDVSRETTDTVGDRESRALMVSDAAFALRFRAYGAAAVLVSLVVIGSTVWLAVPGGVFPDSTGDPAAATFARLLCPGIVPLTINILLLTSGIRTMRGSLTHLRRARAALAMQWLLGLLLVVLGLIRPSTGWPVAVVGAVLFVISFGVEFPLRRGIRLVRRATGAPAGT